MDPDETPGRRPSKVAAYACLQCRKIKTKCNRQSQNAKCVRCSQKSLSCDYLRHRRGRKIGFKLHRAGETPVIAFKNANLTSQTRSTPSSPLDNIGPEPNVLVDADILVNSQGVRQSISPSRPPSTRITRPHQEFWTQSSGFQPADILSRQATRGTFSMRSVLSTQHGDTPQQTLQKVTEDDPIDKGLVNVHVATSLFDGFMKHMNPFVSHLDPCLHTFDYVRGASSFLLAAILAAASKLLHASLYPALYAHAEGLLVESFRCGWKSIEIIQAMLILTYWKRPDDSRAWLSVGYAIRMAIELGWHQLGTDEMRLPPDVSEFQARKHRNVERTWLVLFVYDRSISLQTGKPWMIDRSRYVESASNWYRHPLAIANDRLLCAFVSLRLITSTHIDTTTSQGVQRQRQQNLQFRSLLRLLDRQIEDWQSCWTEAIAGDGEDCHAFLIPFYGSYSRLLLFTSQLRGSLRLKDIVSSVDTEAIWNSCSSALDMLKLVPDLPTSQLLYFAQDSVHIMIAYATVFLIKFLVSAPTYIQSEIETPAMDAIRNAARTLASQGAPTNTSCALQAKFLHNVILEYGAIRERPWNNDHPSLNCAASNAPTADALPEPATLQQRSIDQVNTSPDPSFAPTRFEQGSEIGTAYDNVNPQPVPSQVPSALNLDFADDNAWALIFAEAGFNVDEGTFLLPA
ncbi:hypothetical protein M3J07_013536 [Ascochyta lentis]